MLLVSQLLGHSSVSTTMRYIGINTDLMRDAVEATTRADVSECRQREAVTAFMPAKTMQGLTFGARHPDDPHRSFRHAGYEVNTGIPKTDSSFGVKISSSPR